MMTSPGPRAKLVANPISPSPQSTWFPACLSPYISPLQIWWISDNAAKYSLLAKTLRPTRQSGWQVRILTKTRLKRSARQLLKLLLPLLLIWLYGPKHKRNADRRICEEMLRFRTETTNQRNLFEKLKSRCTAPYRRLSHDMLTNRDLIHTEWQSSALTCLRSKHGHDRKQVLLARAVMKTKGIDR